MADSIQYDIVEREHASSLEDHVHHFVSKVILRGGDGTVEGGKLVDIIDKFFEVITELYNELVLSVAKPNDVAAIILSTAKMNHPISTPYRTASDLTADHIATAVSKAHNSGLEVSICVLLLGDKK
jgi:hypothetical protein